MVIANSARLAGDSKVIRDEDREEGSTYLAKAKGQIWLLHFEF